MTPLENKKLNICLSENITLDGRPARAGDYHKDCGYISLLSPIRAPGAISHIELSWDTIIDIVENKDGKFSSKM